MSKILETLLTHMSISIPVILFIAAVVFPIVYFLLSKKTENTTDSYDKAAINNALIGAGINTKKENFQDSAIVYNSVDKIKNNFETFITTYFPFLDIKIMNDMLKNDYGVNKTIKEIISEHPDANLNMLIQAFLPQIILYLSSMLIIIIPISNYIYVLISIRIEEMVQTHTHILSLSKNEISSVNQIFH